MPRIAERSSASSPTCRWTASERHPTWAQQHPELRFKRWDQIAFKTARISRHDHGGLADPLWAAVCPQRTRPRRIWRREPGAEGDLPQPRHRRADYRPDDVAVEFIDYSAEGVGARVLKTFDSTVYQLEAASANAPGRLSVIDRTKPEAKLRAPTAEIANDNVVRVTLREQGAVALETKLKARRSAISTSPRPETASRSAGTRASWISPGLGAARQPSGGVRRTSSCATRRLRP